MGTLDVLTAEKPPLQKDEAGVYRVGGTRVRLDTIVIAFQYGSTAEEILLKYPSLSLPDIYSVLAYYLQHCEEVEVYMADREQAEREVERESRERFPSASVRERLLARKWAA